jgi:hypothetical protein
MDNKTAKNKLRELRDSLSEILDEGNTGDIKASIKEVRKTAQEGSKQLKKSFVEQIKSLPVVDKVAQLGTAGTIAIGSSAVTQVDLAKDYTEVFVAEVAQDVIEERFEVPQFIDSFVDFDNLNVWGQQIIAEKVAEVSELQQTSQPSSSGVDTTPKSSSSSPNTSSDTPSQTQDTEQSQESEKTESKTEQKTDSSKSSDSEKDNKGKPETTQEQKTEDKQESQESNTSTEASQESDDVNSELPVTETPFEQIGDEIKPHSNIRQVSPI